MIVDTLYLLYANVRNNNNSFKICISLPSAYWDSLFPLQSSVHILAFMASYM